MGYIDYKKYNDNTFGSGYGIMKNNIFKKLKENIDAYITVYEDHGSLSVSIKKDGETSFNFYETNFFKENLNNPKYCDDICYKICGLYKKQILSKYFYSYRGDRERKFKRWTNS